jgi:hypothetical protein
VFHPFDHIDQKRGTGEAGGDEISRRVVAATDSPLESEHYD